MTAIVFEDTRHIQRLQRQNQLILISETDLYLQRRRRSDGGAAGSSRLRDAASMSPSPTCRRKPEAVGTTSDPHFNLILIHIQSFLRLNFSKTLMWF